MNKQVTILLTIFLFLGAAILFVAGRSKQNNISVADEIQEIAGGTIELSEQNINENNKLQKQIEENSGMKNKSYSKAPAMQIDKTKDYTVVMTTSEGDITIALNAQQTPITANNFYTLAKDGFYDDISFHRTIEGFMIQGGDPQGNGMGGPGYKFADESFKGEYTRGTVAMANSGPNTNGSQFFIMHKDYPLPPSYTIFGTVIDGMDVVDAIATAPIKPGSDAPVAPIAITAVKVTEN